ncbi:MAG: hypothetical protein HY436_01280 [Candidatus Liptonbacteria bacterium]|nr:hypothetical protein [Candidatus Liptonbacteria bacterium]
MRHAATGVRRHPPEMFRPLLWSLDWERVDVDEDKEDIIVNAVNEGTLAHWRWMIRTYGKEAIRRILAKRLASEFHPESRNLARVVFGVAHFRHARGSTH